MKSLPCLLAALTLTFTAPSLFAADEAPAAPQEKKPETELSMKMEKMNGAFRKLRRQAGDPAMNADSLEQVAILRESAEASLKLAPAKAESMPAADRQKWVAEYQVEMGKLVDTIKTLDAALKAGQNEEAAKIVQALAGMQRTAHKEYRAEEKK